MIELMVALGLAAILLTLSASAIRNFWLGRALDASVDSTVTQLRQVQGRSVGETHPLTYGLRLRPNSNAYSIVRFNPRVATDPNDDVCEEVGTRTFEDGVVVSSMAFSDGSSAMMTACTTALPSYVAGDDFVFFYARGSATPGSLTLLHSTSGDSDVISVLPLTGRVIRS